jgi:NADP-dependent 3-hydroxy acid dehydrogenase YdfG
MSKGRLPASRIAHGRPAAARRWDRPADHPEHLERTVAEPRDLTGSVAVITGATAGIGRETARALVRHGARVGLGGRRVQRLDALVEELGAENAVAVAMDVRSPADNARLVAAAVDRWGRLDVVVPNAGVGRYGGILDHSDEQVSEMIDTNYTGTVWTVRAGLPALLAAGGGDVVIVSSVAGLRGGADEAVYAGTKHAQVGLAGSLDRELRAKGVRVSAICPAGTATEFAIGAGRTVDDPRFGDWLEPADVAAAIVTALRQPRTVRTAIWTLWGQGQDS